MERIRLLLIDRHTLFRESLSRLLAGGSDFEVVGACETCAQALEMLNRARTDLVLLDSCFGGLHWRRFIPSARREGYTGKILMFTSGTTAEASAKALHTGASGVLRNRHCPALAPSRAAPYSSVNKRLSLRHVTHGTVVWACR